MAEDGVTSRPARSAGPSRRSPPRHDFRANCQLVLERVAPPPERVEPAPERVACVSRHFLAVVMPESEESTWQVFWCTRKSTPVDRV